MFRIIDKRCSGKTSRLMLIAKDNNATIACANPHAMKVKAESYGITGLNFISYADLLSRGSSNGDVLIDELETFVQYVITNTGNMIGYSISED